MTGPAPVLQFRVAGLPVTQGSMSAFIRGGRAIVTDQKGPKLKPWREAIRSTAVEIAGDGWQPLTGPIRILLLFALPKPASAPKRRRTWPVGQRSGDWDKLARAACDALTDAGIWRDDSQVVDGRAIKDYPGEHLAQNSPGVLIRIWRSDDVVPPPSTGQIPLLATTEPGGTT